MPSWRDLDRLERGARVNIMKFSMAKCKALHMGRGNPNHKYRLGREWIENSPEEKDLGLLADEKLNMTRWCVLAAWKASCTLGCIPSNMGTGTRFCPALLRPPRSPASSSGDLSRGQSWSRGSGARGGSSNDARAGTPLLGGKAGRAGAAQPGEEKAAGRPQSSCQHLRGPTREVERGFVRGHVVIGQGGMAVN